MAQVAYRDDNALLINRKTDWGAIWAGVFTFAAIWAVFGSLGFAIFASSANSNATRPVSGMSAGIEIWAVILTIIAMYVAGRETAHLAQLRTRHDGVTHGMIMFGLAVVAAFILTMAGGSALTAAAQNTGAPSMPYALNIAKDLGWPGFIALLLGWLAAIWGASSAIVVVRPQAEVRDIRPAA